MGCSFDTWSRGIGDRLFVGTLILLAYVVPLVVICACYTIIYVMTRQSHEGLTKARTVLVTDNGKNSCETTLSHDDSKTVSPSSSDTAMGFTKYEQIFWRNTVKVSRRTIKALSALAENFSHALKTDLSHTTSMSEPRKGLNSLARHSLALN